MDEGSLLSRVACRQIFGVNQRDAAGEAAATTMAGSVGPGEGNGVIVIDPNVDWLLFILTAAFFALAVSRTAHLLFN